MDDREVIGLLNEDIRGEHGAIILYLRIAYGMGEGEVASDVEQIARDEMRHLKWLSEEVVRRGGVPTTERDESGAGTSDPLALMRLAVEGEQSATETYTAHAEAIGDPRTALLLERILTDERYHHGKFQRLIQALEESAAAPEAPPETPPEGIVESVQENVRLEYTTLLQYLQQSFLTPDCPLSKDLLDQAIIEMTHMGWLAEYLAEAGVAPRMEHDSVEDEGDPERLLQANVQVEVGVEEVYRRQLESAQDPSLQRLLQRIFEHSVYHEAHFRGLLADVQGRAAAASEEAPEPPTPARAPAAGWTVGSLLGRKQV